MFKVNNARIIGKISRRSLKSARTRNAIAVVAIILTAVMFTTLFSIGTSVVESFQLSTMRQVGTQAHGGFKFMTQQQYDKVAADPKVKDISYNIIIGTGENPELIKVPTEIRYTEEKAARWGFNFPTTGTLPKNRLDIATTTEVLDALGVPHELGAAVPLEFTANGKKYHESFRLCGWWENEIVLSVNQVFLSRGYADEVAPAWQDGQEYYDYTEFSGSVNPSLYFASSWDLEKQMSELKERCGFGADVNEGVNWAYMTESVDTGTIALIAGLLALIMLSGYLVIYNIFYISVNGKIRFYGLLKTIGTTNRQLKQLVHREALLLSCIGIPLGLVLGCALSAVLVPAVIGMTSIGVYKVSVNPLIFVGSGIFTLITVWISCIKPCKLVCCISPIDAVRYTAEASEKKKRKRTKRVTPFVMAAGNIGRTKKKTVAVVLSLSLALILLNITFSLTRGFDMDKYLQDHIVSDFYVTDASLLNGFSAARSFNSLTPEVQEQLEALDGVTETGHMYMREYKYTLNDNEHKTVKEIIDRHAAEGVNSMVLQQVYNFLEQGFISSHIYGADGLAEDKLKITEGKFDREKFESGNYVIAAIGGGAAGGARLWEIGDKVTLAVRDGQEKEYEIMALGNVPSALGAGHGHGFDAYFILPSAEFISLTGETGAMHLVLNAAPDKISSIDAQIKNYCEGVNTALDYRSRQSYIDEFKDTQNTYLLVGSLLSFILALIGILNFINAIVTSIQSRRQELAMLQSIGMTGKQLKQMLISEGAYYIIFTALFTLTLGSLFTYGMMRTVENVIWYFSYHFIITPVLVIIPIMLAFAMLIPVISYTKMCRQSIVERLRETES